jgi:hypothetical protein
VGESSAFARPTRGDGLTSLKEKLIKTVRSAVAAGGDGSGLKNNLSDGNLSLTAHLDDLG